jgi:hypothetical protein
MKRFKAVAAERYGGHYGVGDTPTAAFDNLVKAMRDDGTPWMTVTAFVLVTWETDGALPPDERTLLGFGALRVTPEVKLRGKGKAAVAKAVAELAA